MENLLSFMSNPYHSDEAARLTREALLLLEQYILRVQVLTKGGRRSTRDFDILVRNQWKYGETIVFQSETLREQWEPGVPPIAERIEAIREAHAREFVLGFPSSRSLNRTRQSRLLNRFGARSISGKSAS